MSLNRYTETENFKLNKILEMYHADLNFIY